jgi:dihydroorotate dehydrogenase (fumarate)
MTTSTSMLGLRLSHPFVAGASPLGWNLDSVKRLEDGGCAALVLPSLFEEQITLAAEGRIPTGIALGGAWSKTLSARRLRSPGHYRTVSRVKRTDPAPA